MLEEHIDKVISRHFNEKPLFVEKMTTGLINEVYKVTLNKQTVIIRMNNRQTNMIGSELNIPLFKQVGITVPSLLYSDYTKKYIPYVYQILTMIDGVDLGKVIETLNSAQLENLAKTISEVIDKIENIPSVNRYGLLCEGNIEAMFSTWQEYIEQYLHEGVQRAKHLKTIDDEIISFIQTLPQKYSEYFSTVKPTPYYEDMCSKNVMIENGIFSGLVDLDYLSFGDYLDAFGRIYASWNGKTYGDSYLNYLYEIRNLTTFQKNMVLIYGLMHKFNWSSENGVQFNSNTTSTINWEKAKRDNEMLRSMIQKIQLL